MTETVTERPNPTPQHVPQRTAPQVVVVGFADTRRTFPVDIDAEHWGLNALHRSPDLPEGVTWDRWFQLHDIEATHGRDQADLDDHLNFLRSLDCPVYLRPQDIGKYDIPSEVAFPVEALVKEFPRYFTNTVSFLLGLAIMMEFEHLHLYGVDMAQDGIMNAEYCVAPGTRVLTSDLRWIPAEQINEGDDVVAFDENLPDGGTYREFRNAKVTGVTELVRPCYRLHLSDGSKLISSAEHRWLSNYGKSYQWWTTEDMHGPIVTPELQERIRADYEEAGVTHRSLSEKYDVSRSAVARTITGDLDPSKCRSHSIVKVMDTWEPDRSWGAGFLAAAFDGEGHLSMRERSENYTGYSVHLGFSQRDNAMAARFEHEMDVRGFTYTKSDGDCVKYGITGGRKEMMRLLGTVRPPRILSQFNPDLLGVMHKADAVAIVEKEPLGEQRVIGIETESGTFIAEGFASHNSHQRPSCEFYLGIAAGAGIQVHIPPGSDLLRASHLYGFEEPDQFTAKNLARLEELAQRKGQMKQEVAQLDGRRGELVSGINQLDGAMQQIQFTLKNWTPNPVGPAPSMNGNGQVPDVR